jgi:hypothetical protein
MLSTTLALLSLLVGTSLATPVETSAVAEPSVGNVYAIPAGGSVRAVNNAVQILNANGAVVQSVDASDAPPTTGVTPLLGDSITYAEWHDPTFASHIDSFNTSWVVPPNPASDDGQTLFYCHAMYSPQPGSPKHAIEAVLQYGPSEAGGGAKSWNTALWYRNKNQIFYTPAIATTPGATLEGSISLVSNVDGIFSYMASFGDGQGLTIATTLEMMGVLNTLDINAVQQASDFPATPTVFRKINVGVVAEANPSIIWNTQSNLTYGITTVVNVEGAKNAKVTMSYLT